MQIEPATVMAPADSAPNETPSPTGRRLRDCLPWFALAGLLALGLPLHVCMPLWCDNYFYDVCARIILRGQLLHRTILYAAPPGMPLFQAAVRGLVGWRSEALRAVDFLIISTSIFLLAFRILPEPRRSAARVWAACLLLFFYLWTTESCHCQPDFWMLLPALAALTLRIRQADRLTQPDASPRRLLGLALLEGVCWGLAFLFKPFVALPALACWLLTTFWTWRSGGGPRRGLPADATGLLGGGLLVGGMIVSWLVLSGNWPYFVEAVRGDWNRDYYQSSASANIRLFRTLVTPWPWCWVHVAAVPAALASVGLSLRKASPRKRESLNPHLALALLAAFYLLWFIQANFLQLQLTYHQASAILLALAVLAGHASLSSRGMTWSLVLGVLVLWVAVKHPVFQPSRLALWGRCWTEGSSPLLRDAITLEPRNSVMPTHVELEEVADFLRSQHVQDRELTCFSLSTVPLYEALQVLPSTRFIELHAALSFFPNHKAEIIREIEASPQRFVVWDVLQVGKPLGDDPEPVTVSIDLLNYYRFFREPVVFRTRRYVVQRVRPPAERDWEEPTARPRFIPATVPEEPAR